MEHKSTVSSTPGAKVNVLQTLSLPIFATTLFCIIGIFILATLVVPVWRAQDPQDIVLDRMGNGMLVRIDWTNNDALREWLVIYNDKHVVWNVELAEGVVIQEEAVLTEDDWFFVESMLNEGCYNLMIPQAMDAHEPRYNINLRCGVASTNTRFVRKPADDVPESLSKLMDNVPAPVMSSPLHTQVE
jgi:hypothetical protein